MSLLSQLGRKIMKAGDAGFDSRYGQRAGDQPRMQNLEVALDDVGLQPTAPIRAEDLEGRGFILSMSDRTGAGDKIAGINDVELASPVLREGGQNYPLMYSDRAFASDKGVVSAQYNKARALAETTGKNPLFIPFRMAPTGNDFSTMTGETMLSYAQSAMGKGNKAKLNRAIKGIFPDWKGIDEADALKQYQAMKPADRKKIRDMMDRDFRDVKGGLSLPEARLAVTDEAQLGSRDLGIQNIMEIDPNAPRAPSPHATYSDDLGGRYLGTVGNDSANAFDLIPEFARRRGFSNFDELNTADQAKEAYTLRQTAPVGVFDNKILDQLQKQGVVKGVGGAGVAGLLSAIPDDAMAMESYAEPVDPMSVGQYGGGLLNALVNLFGPDIQGNIGDGTLTEEMRRRPLYGQGN